MGIRVARGKGADLMWDRGRNERGRLKKPILEGR